MVFFKAINSRKVIMFVSIIIPILYSSCTKLDEEQKENILAKVGDKTISLKEFMRRAEYTIRPQYCKGNNNIDKKIILNSLLAEKMLALEAEKDRV